MVGPTRALWWEFYRLSRRPVATMTAAGCSLAVLYRRALEPLGEQRDGVVFVALFVTLLIVIVVALLSCRSDDAGGLGLGFERRLYRLPLSSTGLVLGRMGPAVLAGAGIYLGTVLFLALAFDVRWPILGPMLVSVVVLVWALALSWSLGRHPYLLAPIGLPLALGLFAWLRPRLEPRRGDVLANWRDFGLVDTSVLLLALALGVLVAIAGVRFDRAEPGDRLTIARGLGVLGRSREEAPVRSVLRRAPFRTAIGAQLWMEWREKGRWFLLWGLAGLWTNVLGAGLKDLVPVFDTGALLRAGFGFLGLFLLVAPPLSGILHGRFHLSSAVAAVDRVRATRPLRDRTLAWTLLAAASISVMVCWAAILVSLLVLGGGLYFWGDREKILTVAEGLVRAWQALTPFDLLLVALVLLAWAAAASGLMASIVLSGRNWVTGLFAVAPMILVGLAFVTERITEIDAWRRVLPLAGLGLVAILPLAVGFCTWLAWRRGHLSGRAVLRGLLAWSAVSVLLALRFPVLRAAFDQAHPWLERAVAVTVPAALSGALLPLALAPLMLEWNRHR